MKFIIDKWITCVSPREYFKSMWSTTIGKKNCDQLFSRILASTVTIKVSARPRDYIHFRRDFSSDQRCENPWKIRLQFLLPTEFFKYIFLPICCRYLAERKNRLGLAEVNARLGIIPRVHDEFRVRQVCRYFFKKVLDSGASRREHAILFSIQFAIDDLIQSAPANR